MHRGGGSLHGFRARDGELHGFTGPRSPSRHELCLPRFIDWSETIIVNIPDGRGGERPELHPTVTRFGQQSKFGHRREFALPAHLRIRRAEAHLDATFVGIHTRTHHALTGEQRHAERDGFARGGESLHPCACLPDEAEFQLALDAHHGEEVLLIVGRLGAGGAVLLHKEDLIFRHAVRLHARDRPACGVDLHLSWFQKKTPLPLRAWRDDARHFDRLHAGRDEHPEITFMTHRHGIAHIYRTPSRQLAGQRHGHEFAGMDLHLHLQPMPRQLQPHLRDFCALRFEWTLHQYSLTELLQHLLGRHLSLGRAQTHEQSEKEHGRGCRSAGERHLRKRRQITPTSEQQPNQKQDQADTQQSDETLHATRDQPKRDLFLCCHWTAPAEADLPPLPLRHCRTGLDLGFGVVEEVGLGRRLALIAGGLPQHLTDCSITKVVSLRKHGGWGSGSTHFMVCDACVIAFLLPSRPIRFQLRIQRLLDLLDDEGRRVHGKEQQRGELDAVHQPGQRRRRRPAGGGEHDDEDHPGEARGVQLMVGHEDAEQAHDGCLPAPGFPHRQRDDEQQEDIEERPRRQPVAMTVVRAKHRQHPPAGREIQLGIQRLRIVLPARGGDAGAAFQTAHGLQAQVPVADLHAFGTVGGALGDELSGSADLHRAELVTLRRIQSPGLLPLPTEVVLIGHVLAVFIQPEAALDRDALRLPHAHATHLFLDLKRLPRRPLVHRILPPRLRVGRLRHIHRWDAADLHETESRLVLQAHQLLGHERLGILRIAHRLRRARAEGRNLDHPLPRPHLHLQPTCIIHRAGHRCLHRGKPPAFGQHMPERYFATLSRHAQLHLRVQPLRRAVADESMHLHGNKIFVRRFRARALQPETALRIPHRRLHRLAVKLEIQHADLHRQMQRLRHRAPLEAAFHHRLAIRRELHTRHAIATHHRRRLIIQRHGLRPALSIARKGGPFMPASIDGESKAASRRLRLDLHRRIPQRQQLRRIVERRRLTLVLCFIPGGPGFPVIEHLRPLGVSGGVKEHNSQQSGIERSRFHSVHQAIKTVHDMGTSI